MNIKAGRCTVSETACRSAHDSGKKFFLTPSAVYQLFHSRNAGYYFHTLYTGAVNVPASTFANAAAANAAIGRAAFID